MYPSNSPANIGRPTAVPAIWVYTTDDKFNGTRPEGYPGFLTHEQQWRLERIRQARLLFDGKHREYFLNENRTQWDFRPQRVGGAWGDRIFQLYVTFNILKLISIKGADLLFLEDALLRVEDDAQDKAIADLIQRCDLHTRFHEWAVTGSYEAESILESIVENGEVYLQSLPTEEVFPIGKPSPNGQYRQYVRYSVTRIGPGNALVPILLMTTYLPGSISRRLYQLDDKGAIVREIDLRLWPLDAGEPPLEADVATGIDDITITWIPNFRDRQRTISDYDGAIELQDTLNAKVTQLGRVLAKHSDPKLALPLRSANELGGQRSDYEVEFYDNPEEIPKYIVWDAELKAASEDRDFALNALCLATEMSPALLGLKTGNASNHATAYKTIRLESYNSISKAARKGKYWRAGIRRAIGVCQALENTIPGIRYDQTPIGVETRDGIPVDDLEQAQRQATLRSAGLMSLKRGITEQLTDPAAVADELKELEEENEAKAAAATPTILMAPPDTNTGAPPPASIEAEEATGAEADHLEEAA
jgi:hypothetical protein